MASYCDLWQDHVYYVIYGLLVSETKMTAHNKHENIYTKDNSPEEVDASIITNRN